MNHNSLINLQNQNVKHKELESQPLMEWLIAMKITPERSVVAKRSRPRRIQRRRSTDTLHRFSLSLRHLHLPFHPSIQSRWRLFSDFKFVQNKKYEVNKIINNYV